MLILVFSSDHYNLGELNEMSLEDLSNLAAVTHLAGDDTADILTPKEFVKLFNSGEINAEHMYLFIDDREG